MAYYWNGNQFVFTPSTFGGYATPQAPQAQSLLSAPPSLMSPVKTNYSQGGDSSIPGMGPSFMGGQQDGQNPNTPGMMGPIGSHISNNPMGTAGSLLGMASPIPGTGYVLGSLGRAADIAAFNARSMDYGLDPMSYANALDPTLSLDPTSNEAMAGYGTDPAILDSAILSANMNDPANIAAANMTDAASLGLPGTAPAQGDEHGDTPGTVDQSGDVGGGGGGTKLICSYLHQIGLMDYHTFFEDQKFGIRLEKTDPLALKGYTLWAVPVVRLMKRYPWTIKIVFRLAMPWARHIASLYRGGSGNAWGAILLAIGIPICRWLGKRADQRQDIKKVEKGR